MVAPRRPTNSLPSGARSLRAARRRLAIVLWNPRLPASIATPSICPWQSALFVAWCLAVCTFYFAGLASGLK